MPAYRARWALHWRTDSFLCSLSFPDEITSCVSNLRPDAGPWGSHCIQLALLAALGAQARCLPAFG